MNMLWMEVTRLFDVNTVAFNAFGYPMSFIEFFGTLFNLWSVWLVARNRILTWPVGLIGVVLFLVLFYQIQLYADTLEQVYYLVASVYGWWFWSRHSRVAPTSVRTARWSTSRAMLTGVVITAILSVILGYITDRLNLWFPSLFPVAASFAYLDALTTIMSFTATILMARKRIDCWIYWIIVDVIGIGLYYAKDIKFIALLYVVFLVMAVNGLRLWLAMRPPAAHRNATEAGYQLG